MERPINHKQRGKIALFRSLFRGLPHVYGTYDPASGRSFQVKAPVTDGVIFDHLTGRKPYGVYLLVQDRTRAVAVDFDVDDSAGPQAFVRAAKHYGLPAYVERSKSKGYHVWIFFVERVLAWRARAVARRILEDIHEPGTEVFPKQDRLGGATLYGSFINAPLFGALVPQGRTVFVDPLTFDPYPDQWGLLKSVQKVGEAVLEALIELNNMQPAPAPQPLPTVQEPNGKGTFTLPPCAQRMFRDGVSQFQRVSCFRLAVHLKRVGLPYDVTVAALKTWALKNRPKAGKQVITEREILAQVSCAFGRDYRGFGCETEAIEPFCDPVCPVRRRTEPSA